MIEDRLISPLFSQEEDRFGFDMDDSEEKEEEEEESKEEEN
ncbi:MAG: hypothetical protein AAB565_01900 [Patescibacteria group bacterium]